MKVRELIESLKREPQDLDVCIWDHDEDEYMPVVQSLFEDGSSEVVLLTVTVPVIPVPPEGARCDVCGTEDVFFHPFRGDASATGSKVNVCLTCLQAAVKELEGFGEANLIQLGAQEPALCDGGGACGRDCPGREHVYQKHPG